MRALLGGCALLSSFVTAACGAGQWARSSRGDELRAWSAIPPGDYLVHDETLHVGVGSLVIAIDLVGEHRIRLLHSSRVMFSLGDSELEARASADFAPLTCTRAPLRFAHDDLVVDVPAGGRVALIGVGAGLARVGPPIAQAGGMTTLVELGSIGLDTCAEASAPSGLQIVPERSPGSGAACAFGQPSAASSFERLPIPRGSAMERGPARGEWISVTAYARGARIAGWMPARALEPTSETARWVRTTQSVRIGPLDVPAGAPGRVSECVVGAAECTQRVVFSLERDGRTVNVRAALGSVPTEPTTPPAQATPPLETPFCAYPDAPPRGAATGTLRRAHIRAVITRRIDSVRACYERALSVWPNITGRVLASFIIGPTGRVDYVATLGDMPTRYVHHCIARVVRDLRFPAPTNGGVVGVNYPFILRVSP